MRDELVKKYLTQEIRTFNSEVDNADYPLEWSSNWPSTPWCAGGIEFTPDNRKFLLYQFLNVKQNTNVIVEIGVSRLSFTDGITFNTNPILLNNTSTSILIKNKKPETLYLGIDIEDKSFLHDLGPNIYTLQSPSENYEVVNNKFNQLGITQIDFLFIDGWHSINQVIDELWYVQFMKPGSVIGFHDVNLHPGPYNVFNNLNPKLFKTTNFNTPDWGIGFAQLI